MKISDLLNVKGRTITLVPDETGNYRLLSADGTPDPEVSITLSYRVSAMSIREEEKLRAAMLEGDTEWLAQAVCAQVTSWDITDDDGVPFPIETEALVAGTARGVFPGTILVDVLQGISNDAGLGKAPSANGSSSSATSAPSKASEAGSGESQSGGLGS